MTNYLKPVRFTIYADPATRQETVAKLATAHRVRADPDGNIEIPPGGEDEVRKPIEPRFDFQRLEIGEHLGNALVGGRSAPSVSVPTELSAQRRLDAVAVKNFPFWFPISAQAVE